MLALAGTANAQPDLLWSQTYGDEIGSVRLPDGQGEGAFWVAWDGENLLFFNK